MAALVCGRPVFRTVCLILSNNFEKRIDINTNFAAVATNIFHFIFEKILVDLSKREGFQVLLYIIVIVDSA